MQIKFYTGRSQVILMIRHEFVDEFFTNFVHEFKYEIRMNSRSYDFLHEKLVMLRMAFYCMCRAEEQRKLKLKFTLVLITWVVQCPQKVFIAWAFLSSGDGFHEFLISLSSLAPQANILKAKPKHKIPIYVPFSFSLIRSMTFEVLDQQHFPSY